MANHKFQVIALTAMNISHWYSTLVKKKIQLHQSYIGHKIFCPLFSLRMFGLDSKNTAHGRLLSALHFTLPLTAHCTALYTAFDRTMHFIRCTVKGALHCRVYLPIQCPGQGALLTALLGSIQQQLPWQLHSCSSATKNLFNTVQCCVA